MVHADGSPSATTSRSTNQQSKGHDVLARVSRNMRRTILANEEKYRRSGEWGPWEHLTFAKGTVGSGWSYDIENAYKNNVFSVLVRDAGNGVVHYAVSSLSQIRPSWWEMQRIKNDLAGPETTAVEVYPPQSEVIDEADMFHFWTLPQRLPFSIHPNAKRPGDRSIDSESDEASLNQITSSESNSDA